jgi:hypothetical protein
MQKTSEVYKHLYHYTNLRGLKGILSSQSLWASHYKCLNDKNEIIFFVEKILPLIIEPAVTAEYTNILINDSEALDTFFKKQGDLPEIIKHDSNLVVQALFEALNDEIYICSFCGEFSDKNIIRHGKLSQWRGYGNENGRFCIVFDTEKLEELQSLEFKNFSYMGLGLGDVVYSDEKERFNEEFKDNIDAIINYVPAITDTIISKKFGKKQKRPAPYEKFLSIMSRHKHFGFKEESEVRIYAHLTPGYARENDKRKDREIEKKGNKKIINLFHGLEQTLPITRIIVGPHSKKEQNIKILTRLLKDTDIQLDISEIPFLD